MQAARPPKPLDHTAFVRLMALIGACWLIVQSNWWLWWLAAYTTCALPAGEIARTSVLSAGPRPTLLGIAVSLLLAMAFWRLIQRRSMAMDAPAPPLVLVATLYLVQTIALVGSDSLLIGGCPTDPGAISPAKDTARTLLIIWIGTAAISLGLAAHHLYRFMRLARSGQ